MKRQIFAACLLTALAGSAAADLKPDVLDCDAQRAARNAAMKATVGVSGKCDAGKVVDKSKDEVRDNAKDAVDIDLDDRDRHRKDREDRDREWKKHRD
jgi:hypothetical protein